MDCLLTIIIANSDCDQLIQLLLPIASKWRVLARVLGLANEIGMKEEEEEEVALDSKAKMERVIRKFRQEKAGEDWVKVLTEVLKRDALRESKLSDEIRRGKNSRDWNIASHSLLSSVQLKLPICQLSGQRWS